MQNAAQAYKKIATQTCSQRELEADLLLQAASKLQAIVGNWDGHKRDDYHAALTYNRKLWVILLSAVTSPGNPLPVETRQNVANLGLFVMNETIELTSKPDIERFKALVNINRQIGAGLLGQP
jgi:flagellar biosynthesis activator protein FlaF